MVAFYEKVMEQMKSVNPLFSTFCEEKCKTTKRLQQKNPKWIQNNASFFFYHWFLIWNLQSPEKIKHKTKYDNFGYYLKKKTIVTNTSTECVFTVHIFW